MSVRSKAALPLKLTALLLWWASEALDALYARAAGKRETWTLAPPRWISAGGKVVTREMALRAGEDLGELVQIITDEVPNSRQLFDIVSGGGRALRDLASTNILNDQKEGVRETLLEGMLRAINLKKGWLPAESEIERKEHEP